MQAQPFTFFWNELHTRDPRVSQEFHAKVFGWEVHEEQMPGGVTYTLFMKDGAPVAGACNMNELDMPPEIPPHWLSYVAVEDAAETCRRTVEQGGKVVREPFDVPNVGTIAILEAADGSVLGVIKPAPQG